MILGDPFCHVLPKQFCAHCTTLPHNVDLNQRPNPAAKTKTAWTGKIHSNEKLVRGVWRKWLICSAGTHRQAVRRTGSWVLDAEPRGSTASRDQSVLARDLSSQTEAHLGEVFCYFTDILHNKGTNLDHACISAHFVRQNYLLVLRLCASGWLRTRSFFVCQRNRYI